MTSFENSQTQSFFMPIRLWKWNRQSVPKRPWEFSNPVILHTYPPMEMEQTECYETSLRILIPSHSSYLFAYKYGTDRVFRNVLENSQTQSFFIPIRLWRWNRQSVMKRRWEFSNSVIFHTYPLIKVEQTECSETSLRILKLSNFSYLSAY